MADETEFKPGDLVRHKTGGPVMCVLGIRPHGVKSPAVLEFMDACKIDGPRVLCEWWIRGEGREGRVEHLMFHPCALIHNEPLDGDGIDVGEIETHGTTHMLDDAGSDPDRECRNCGMTRAEHVSGVCPGGDGRWRP